jgi:hypothetical protein
MNVEEIDGDDLTNLKRKSFVASCDWIDISITDIITSKLCCQYNPNSNNMYVCGNINYRKAFRHDHAKSSLHNEALNAKRNATRYPFKMDIVEDVDRKIMPPIFKNILYLAKEDLPPAK